uniref:Uncharacterized protein n=1 Tax=Oryza punctata TaxID=4537 RepID=A0A0E0LG77_ORYPU
MPARSRFEDELEAEALAERRIVSAKKSSMGRNIPLKPSFPAHPPRRQANEYSESEREESEYETEGEDLEHSPTQGREDELDEEDEYEEDVEEEAAMSDEELRNQSGGENLGVPVPAKGARRSTRTMILHRENNRLFIVGRRWFLTVTRSDDEKKKLANTNS